MAKKIGIHWVGVNNNEKKFSNNDEQDQQYSAKQNLTCEEVLDRIINELCDDVNDTICEELLNHLSVCQECQNKVHTLQKTVELYRCLEKTNVPSDVHARLITILNLEL